ncbi:metal ABC transporter ATP-binding protein [Microbacterium sp. YY-01]|uniref:metal ABC transporter ATP-binding protein n=1 Tax=Microbacterium sp. YY-01 TaxID=3421634 RepID=UPI003D177BDE
MKPSPLLRVENAAVRRPADHGGAVRTLWYNLDLAVHPGELIAILGPSGGGKTTLLRSILGLQKLSAGSIRFASDHHRPHDRDAIGYVPQQRTFSADTALRARDVVALGLHGTRYGLPVPRRGDHARVDATLREVGAFDYGHRRVGALSGGEVQRLRVGQAVIHRPSLLLADEPLTNLDPAHQRGIVDIIDRQRRDHDTAVLVVTHDINPLLGRVDRILYLAGGRFRFGTPDDVLRSSILSDLYRSPVDVIRAHGRIIVAGTNEATAHHDEVQHPDATHHGDRS